MNGSVGVESDTGQGSTFTFTATLALEPARESTTTPGADEVLRDLHVLVVDDNATNRSIFSSLLARYQARVHAVDSGAAALAELARAQESGTPYQLVLMDVQMPGMSGLTAAEQIRRELELDVPIIILTSSGQPGDAARCRAQGLSGYLTKPVMSSELLEAIRAIFGGVRAGRPDTFVTRHSLREERGRVRVLLAEDHSVNRIMITRMLEKCGHAVHGVENGRQVLEALEAGEFDLVLMDLQMPELDGYETTAAIRSQERGTTRRIPIVALTAHATVGVAERCLQHGMDAHVSKPIRAEKLFETIESVLSRGDTDIRVEPDAGGSARVLDVDEVLRFTEGDRELLAELVQHHRDETARLIDGMRRAVEAGDATTLQQGAHRLRGGLGMLAARPAAEAAHRLEKLAIDGDGAARQAALAALEQELERLAPALDSMLKAA
jgi:CheY-like chemotaxis protein